MTVYVDDLTLSGNHLTRLHLCPVAKTFRSAGLRCHKTRMFAAKRPKAITGTVISNDGLRLPNRRHLRMIEGIRRLADAVDPEERIEISSRLRGQINEASSVDQHCKAKLPGLRMLVDRLEAGS